jgi:hypothetical protein
MLLKRLKNKKGFTMTEVILVTLITMMVMLAIITAWIFTYKTWTGESEKTYLRMDLMGALETIKADVRLSSLAQGDMAFYPTGGGVYTAVSVPVADVDSGTGLFAVDEDAGIEWDRTVIYHIFTEDDGSETLRRTIYDPRDNTMTEEARYTQLSNVVANGVGGSGSTTDDTFLENLDSFEISPLSSVVDFYDESSSAIQVGKIVFGWATLDAGDHVIKFEIIDPNPASSGNDIGIDTIMIEPSGSRREVEFYQDVSNINVSGGSMDYPEDSDFNNKMYAEFEVNGVGSDVEFTDYYDLWRESAFDDASFSNVEIPDAIIRVELKIPDEGEEGIFVWSAGDEVGQEGADGHLLGDAVSGVVPPTAFRTVITSGNIPWSSDLVRISLRSSSSASLKIDKAYITKRKPEFVPPLPALPEPADEDGLVNIDPTGVSDPVWKDYHKHQQLFFKTGSTIAESVTIAAGSEVWSEWTAYPIQDDSDYLISLYVENSSNLTCKYWPGTVGTARTYYVVYTVVGSSSACVPDPDTDIFTAVAHGLSNGDRVAIGGTTVPTGLSDSPNLADLAGVPSWNLGPPYYVVNKTDDTFQVSVSSGSTAIDFSDVGTSVTFEKITMSVVESPNIYVTANIDTWDITGNVTSQVFDTTISSPAYNQIKWAEGGTGNTVVSLKARTSANNDMSGATGWDSLSAYTTSGDSLSIGSGRYVQFLAELSTAPFWEVGASQKTYQDYIADQTALSAWQFPSSLAGDPYTTQLDSTWVDDVEIDWPGQERICAVSGYVAKKNSYGRAEVTIDGAALLKVLSIYISTTKETRDKVISAENTIEVEPRNTGK